MHIWVSEKKLFVGFGLVLEDRVCLFHGIVSLSVALSHLATWSSPGLMVLVHPTANRTSIIHMSKYTPRKPFLAVHMSGRCEITPSYVVGSRVGGNDGEA